jgi:hypothetical protein
VLRRLTGATLSVAAAGGCAVRTHGPPPCYGSLGWGAAAARESKVINRGVAVGRGSRVAASHGGVRACVSAGQVPLLGRDAVDNAESIMRKVHDARAEFVRRK